MKAGQRGVTIVEALIASIVMGGALLALVQAHLKLHGVSDAARLRRQALVLAQADIELLRASAAAPRDADATEGPFSLRRRTSSLGRGLHAVDVAVAWQNRDGQAESLALRSLIAVADASYGGALALSEPAIVIRPPSSRPAGGSAP
jgi:Tfp pilus assembly protein PilV